ncbi:unnamed protein product [Rodentolepis nana]|uniref:Prolyl endopeptidase n=1 Tax=Rodentolepis nana TaxID=102285 RepID=A0A0R3T5Z6_RODNA|nr:unnamed protein product [Rodentolepis nana]
MVFDYPVFERDESVVDNFFGTKVYDPYRWLEDPDSYKTKQFVQAQNNITIPYLDSCSYRKEIKSKITDLWNYEKYQCVFQRGSKYFYFYNSGLQNQSVLYMTDDLSKRGQVFFDPNTLSEDGLISLNTFGFSKDGEYFAYGLSNAGSDWVTIYVKKVVTGEDLVDKLEKVKFTSIKWTVDGKGFFYGCYLNASTNVDGTETDTNVNQKLMYHYLGRPQSEDIICVEWPEHPKWLSQADVSDCGRYVFITVREGCERNNLLYYLDMEEIGHKITDKLTLTPIVDSFEAVFDFITVDGRRVVIQTDLGAPMYKLIVVDLNNSNRENWKDLIPHDESCLLEWAVCVNEKDLVVCSMKDVCHSLSVHALESGKRKRNIPVDIGSISAFSGRKEDTLVFFQFTSFFTPGIVYSYDLTDPDAKPRIVFQTEVRGLDLSNFESKQIFYSSGDGTRIPMFILHQKNFVANGKSPCLLYGYGGFGHSLNPFFSLTYPLFLQFFNGVVAVANIRGGGEYGEKWHSGGKLLNKQNSFDDFIAGAEFLIKNNYTSPNRLVIEGASNGGLLVSVCTNQRPDLFAATICQVPVTDMLRFHRFTIGHAWRSDYGDISKKEVFRCIMK